MATIRSYIFIDQLQPKTMCYLGSFIRGVLPRSNFAGRGTPQTREKRGVVGQGQHGLCQHAGLDLPDRSHMEPPGLLRLNQDTIVSILYQLIA